jgi:membrane protease YdiL (CAAX protease family)
MWIEHILVGFIVIVMPCLSVYELQRLKKSQDPNGKVKIYLKSLVILWTLTGIIGYISSPKELYYFNYSIEISLIIKLFLVLCLIFFVVTTIAPLFLLKNKEFKGKLIESFQERQFLFPVKKLEIYLFGFVAISVGICEEVIFRSFLVDYLYALPIGVSIITSMIIAGILFGIGHFHQGINGVISAIIVGFLMSYLFIATGSLLLPMIVHAVYDMKIILLSRIAALENNKQKSTKNEDFLEI